MPQFDSLEEVRDAVENNGNILTVDVAALRDAYGAQRLGVVVRENISNALLGLGVGHAFGELPESQGANVLLYKLGTPAALLIDAIVNPDPKTDNRIRDALSNDKEEIIKKIRELVC